MRKNEFNKLSDFTSQYIGEWNPSAGHWFGLDFFYHDKEYRFSTGSMYNEKIQILPNGKEAVFFLYTKKDAIDEYILLGAFATMNDVLKSTLIENTSFETIIISDETELLGQD